MKMRVLVSGKFFILDSKEEEEHVNPCLGHNGMAQNVFHVPAGEEPRNLHQRP